MPAYPSVRRRWPECRPGPGPTTDNPVLIRLDESHPVHLIRASGHNPDMGVYRRTADEYRRPEGRLDLRPLECAAKAHTKAQVELVWAERCCNAMAVRGTDYTPKAYEGLEHGRYWFELVPELNNPYDASALALDLNGKLAGYVGASVSRYMHWRIRTKNLNGSACYVPGRIDKKGVLVCLPTLSWFDEQQADQDLVVTRLAAIWDDLSPGIQSAIEADAFHVRAPEVWSEWYQRRHVVPEVNFQKMFHPTRVPAVLDLALMRIRLRRREERERLKAQKRIEAEGHKKRAQEEKDRARLQRRVQVGAALRAGGSVSSVASLTGASLALVREVRQSLGIAALAPSSRMGRIEASRRALEMFERGNSRQEVADEMGIGMERVKALLALGRFLREPALHPERLELARRAAHSKWTKSTVPSGARFLRAMTDARDLAETNPDLLNE